jgi:hypothetical protein
MPICYVTSYPNITWRMSSDQIAKYQKGNFSMFSHIKYANVIYHVWKFIFCFPVVFILKTTGTFTPVHSAGYLILRNEFRSTQEVARQNIQVSFYIRSTGLWPNTWIHVSQSLAIIRNAMRILWPVNATCD